MKSLFFVFCLFSLFACNGSSGSKKSNDFSNLKGQWSTVEGDIPCTEDQEKPGNYNRLVVVIGEIDASNKYLQQVYLHYNDPACSTEPDFSRVNYYSYTISGTTLTATLVGEFIDPMTDVFTASANSESLCGLTGWQTNEPKLISQTDCSTDPVASYVLSNISLTNTAFNFILDEQQYTYYRIPEESEILGLNNFIQ